MDRIVGSLRSELLAISHRHDVSIRKVENARKDPSDCDSCADQEWHIQLVPTRLTDQTAQIVVQLALNEDKWVCERPDIIIVKIDRSSLASSVGHHPIGHP